MNFLVPISIGRESYSCSGCSQVVRDFYREHSLSPLPVGRELAYTCSCGLSGVDLLPHLLEEFDKFIYATLSATWGPGDTQLLLRNYNYQPDPEVLLYGAAKDLYEAADTLGFNQIYCEYHADIQIEELLEEESKECTCDWDSEEECDYCLWRNPLVPRVQKSW